MVIVFFFGYLARFAADVRCIRTPVPAMSLCHMNYLGMPWAWPGWSSCASKRRYGVCPIHSYIIPTFSIMGFFYSALILFDCFLYVTFVLFILQVANKYMEGWCCSLADCMGHSKPGRIEYDSWRMECITYYMSRPCIEFDKETEQATKQEKHIHNIIIRVQTVYPVILIPLHRSI